MNQKDGYMALVFSAKNGKKKYFKYFNSTNVAEFILSKSFGIKKKYFWEDVN